jgi:hypothetical protein
MLNFNGLKFAKNSDELVSTLFQSGGTASGTYKSGKNGTNLYMPNGELFAYIVHNSRQGYFAVSAGMHNGKPFYMHGTTEQAEKYLRLDTLRYSDTAEVIRSAFS